MQVTSQLRTFSVEQGSLRSRVWGEGWTYGSSYGWEQFYIEVWSRNGKTCISKGNDLTASANLPDQWLSLQVILEPSIGNREGKFCILLPFYFFLQITLWRKLCWYSEAITSHANIFHLLNFIMDKSVQRNYFTTFTSWHVAAKPVLQFSKFSWFQNILNHH